MINKDIYDNEDEEATPSEMKSVVVTFIMLLAIVIMVVIIGIVIF